MRPEKCLIEFRLLPDDYGEQLYAVELEMLVDYLAGLK